MDAPTTSRPGNKRVLGVWAEPEFYEILDALRKAERPPISRAQMVRKLVLERAVPEPKTNGHRAPRAKAKAEATA